MEDSLALLRDKTAVTSDSGNLLENLIECIFFLFLFAFSFFPYGIFLLCIFIFTCIDREECWIIHNELSLILLSRVEIGFCVPSFWAITRVRPLSTMMMRVERHVRTSPQQQVSVTLSQNWQESLSVTFRLWMWTTGTHSNTEKCWELLIFSKY